MPFPTSTPTPPLPPIIPAPTITPQPTDVSRGAVQRTATVHAAGGVLPVIYGRINIGGQVVYRTVISDKLYVVFLVGHGPISQIVKATSSGVNVTTYGTATFYAGTAAQAVNGTLNAYDPAYTSGKPGKAYAVIAFNAPSETTPQYDPYSVTFEVEGLLVRDPRNNLPPSAGPSFGSVGGAGNLVGTYLWKYTFVDSSGDESPGSPDALDPTNRALFLGSTLASKQMNLASIAAGPAGTTKRRIYRTTGAALGFGPFISGSERFFYVGEIANNTTTTFTDNVADASLGKEIPYVSTKRVYSDNPALAIADYLASRRYGCAKGDAAIDWLGSFTDAANDCDAQIRPAAGAAPTAADVVGGGFLSAGTYSYKYTTVNASFGESLPSAVSNTITASANDRAFISGIPSSTDSIYLYRTKAGQAGTGPWYRVQHLLPPGTTSYTDSESDSGTGLGPQTIDSSTVKRYRIGIALQDRQSPDTILTHLRAHCAGFLVYNNGLHKLYIDVARSAQSFSFTDDPTDATRNVTGPCQFRLSTFSETPTKVIVNYTDALEGYKDGSAEDEDSGFLPDLDSTRTKTYDLRGIPTYDQAKRIAKYLRLSAKYRDQHITARVLFDGVQALPMDRVSISSALCNITGKEWLLSSVEQEQDGIAFVLQGDLWDDRVHDDGLGAAGPPTSAAVDPGGHLFTNPVLPPSPSVPNSLTYGESTDATDGSRTTFHFTPAIGTLLTAWAGAGPVKLSDCSVVGGALVLAFAPGDPANVGAVIVSAQYLA